MKGNNIELILKGFSTIQVLTANLASLKGEKTFRIHGYLSGLNPK
jgi:hypothetical protein